MHLMVGIQPALTTDVLFELVALKGRNSHYVKDSIARDFWEERTCVNKYHLFSQMRMYAYEVYTFHIIFHITVFASYRIQIVFIYLL